MRSPLRTLGLFLALTAAVAGPSLIAPSAAIANTTATVATSAASPSTAEPSSCEPAHRGRDWRWHGGRYGGHWDRREWDSGGHGVWKHYWNEDRYCEMGMSP